MHVKVSMRPVDSDHLSEHEIKRCRTVARGQPWEVWEEDILWWSPDKVRWEPLEATVLPRRRRWLIVDGEDNSRASLIWDLNSGFTLPAPARQGETLPEPRPI